MLRSNSAALQQHGQKLYQQGDFSTAVEAFTEALSKKDADYVGILDNRAATYSKLAQYDLALRDARHMIKRDKLDERGYLRCAKILILDKKLEKALDVYAYGLKTIPRENSKRQLVQRLHDKLCARMDKCLDPFSVLPLEIADMVLQYLDFRQIVAILRVSKKWEQFIISLRKLWMRIDLTGARGKVPWSSVRTYIKRSNAMLSHAIVKNVASRSVQKTLELLSRCPNLEYLEIWDSCDAGILYGLLKSSKRLRTLVTSANISLTQEHISKLFSSLPLLERAEFYSTEHAPLARSQWPENLPNLKRLTFCSKGSPAPITHVPGLYIPGVSNPTGSCSIPNLEELRLDSDTESFEALPFIFRPDIFPRLRLLDLNGLCIGRGHGLPPTLEHIRVRGGLGVSEFPFAIDAPVELPNLRTLVLNDIPWATARTISLVLGEGQAPLRVLHLDSCFKLQGPDLLSLKGIGSFSTLTELNINCLWRVDDSLVSSLIGNMSKLKVLHLSQTRITGCTVKLLADLRTYDGNDKPKIERLYMKDCEDVSSDAIAYGRAKGIKIFT